MKSYVIVIVIVLVFVALFFGLGYLYYWIFTDADFPLVVRGGIVAGTAALIAALIKAGVDRIREIHKGEEDDLGKY